MIDIGDAQPLSIYLGAYFDSTHFANGTAITISFQAEDNYARFYNASGSAVTSNRAVAFDRNDFSLLTGGAGAHMVWEKFGPTNYSRFYINTIGWSANDISLQMSGTSVLYVNTHGNNFPARHSSDIDEGGSPMEYLFPLFTTAQWDGTTYSGLSYFNMRNAVNGGGLPPYKSTHQPPISLFMLDACLACTDEIDYSQALFPYGTIYADGYLRNQAKMGWTCLEYPVHSELRMQILMNHLRNKETLDQALYWVYKYSASHYLDAAQATAMYCKTDINGLRLMISETYWHLYGDKNLRLFGIYTGSTWLPQPDWYF